MRIYNYLLNESFSELVYIYLCFLYLFSCLFSIFILNAKSLFSCIDILTCSFIDVNRHTLYAYFLWFAFMC